MSGRPTVRYTWRDYLAIPEDPGRRHEIVDGELHVTAAPRFRHQEVVTNIIRTLGPAVARKGLGVVVAGPLAVRLHDELVLEPDVVFVRRDRMDIVDPEGAIHGPPDLVVEVLSPATRDYDRGLKRKRHLENGVPEVWIVDADRKVLEVWRPGRDEPVLAGETFEWTPGEETVEVALADVLA
jgi:Uma2 family endonuclease